MGIEPPPPPRVPGEPPDVEQRIRTLTRLTAALAVLVVAALGIGAYLLVNDRADTASSERVARLGDRIDRLERRVDQTTHQSVASLQAQLQDKADRSDVQKLRRDVADLRASLDDANAKADATATTLGRLEQRVDRIAGQVQALRAQSGTTP